MTGYEKPSDEELKRRLTPRQYEVTQHEGTEPFFEDGHQDQHLTAAIEDLLKPAAKKVSGAAQR